jgi:hypothetical protein
VTTQQRGVLTCLWWSAETVETPPMPVRAGHRGRSPPAPMGSQPHPSAVQGLASAAILSAEEMSPPLVSSTAPGRKHDLSIQDHHRSGDAQPHIAGAAGRSKSRLPHPEHHGRAGDAREPSGWLNFEGGGQIQGWGRAMQQGISASSPDGQDWLANNPAARCTQRGARSRSPSSSQLTACSSRAVVYSATLPSVISSIEWRISSTGLASSVF